MCQARKKVLHGAFTHLLDWICECVNQTAPLATYHDLRVLAVDGSTFRLPDTKELRETFGVAKNKYGERACARISILHDILNRLTYDAAIEPYRGDKACSESEMAWDHVVQSKISRGSLILMDRGYVDFALLRHIYDEGFHFCVRLKDGLTVLKEFNKFGSRDAQLSLKPPRNVARAAKEGSTLRQPLSVRLVRQKVGKEEYILMTTLLDAECFVTANSAPDLRERRTMRR